MIRFREQEEKRRALTVEDVCPWACNRCLYDPENDQADPKQGVDALRHVAGVDISFIKDDNVNACAAVAVISLPDMKVLTLKIFVKSIQ